MDGRHRNGEYVAAHHRRLRIRIGTLRVGDNRSTSRHRTHATVASVQSSVTHLIQKMPERSLGDHHVAAVLLHHIHYHHPQYARLYSRRSDGDETNNFRCVGGGGNDSGSCWLVLWMMLHHIAPLVSLGASSNTRNGVHEPLMVDRTLNFVWQFCGSLIQRNTCAHCMFDELPHLLRIHILLGPDVYISCIDVFFVYSNNPLHLKLFYFKLIC